MKYWPLMTEVISLLLLLILVWNLNHKKRTFLTPTVRWFWASLFMTAFCIVLNISCTILLLHSDRVPYGVNMFMNTMYFICIVSLSAMIAMYVFRKLLEHVYDVYCIRRAKIILGVLTSVYIVTALLNLRFGFIFWIDSGGGYHRGVLNSLGYGITAIEMALMYLCYFRHRDSVSKEMKRAIILFPPIMCFLILVQIVYPVFLLNGLMATLAELILFLSFHNQRRGFDSITTLSNRDAFFSELRLKTAGSQKFQVLLVTLRDFNEINNRYGYQAGNEFLYSVALWLENFSKDAAVFRYIGVTYAVMMPYTGEDDAKAYRAKLQERFEKPWAIGQDSRILRAVFGEFVYSGEGQDADSTIEVLDYILSTMKRAGQLWVRFDNAMSAQVIRRRKISGLLQETIHNREFEVWYQPIYCLKERSFCSAEALVRMKDRNGAYISPAEFIPVAEDLGMIDQIFWIVLEHVCRFLSSRKAPGIESISVNLSMVQLENTNLAEQVLKVIKTYGLHQDDIKFEITERQFSDNSAIVQSTIRKMTECGFQFYLDDFGIGYSNFSAVTKYSFEFIKLDKTLVDHVLTDSRNRLLVQNLISMFRNLGVKVVVEGVETKEQMEYLAEQKIERVQGYYFAKPMNQELLTEFLGSNS